MVEKYLSLTLFLSFLPFLHLLQSVPFCTKAGGLVMMRGIIYTNLINIIFPVPLIFFLLLPPSDAFMHHGAQLRFPLAAALQRLDHQSVDSTMLLFYAMLHLVHLKELKTFLQAAFILLENPTAFTQKNTTTQRFCHV